VIHLLSAEQTQVGIRSFGTYIPKTYQSAKEIAEKSGIPEDVIREKFGVYQKPVADAHETTSFMGIEAAKKALEREDIDPLSIDVVIWNGAQHKDYQCWLAGIKVAEALGAKNAWSFDMEAMCGSMMTGLDLAKSILISHADYTRVLLVSGYRNNDLISYDVPETSFMFDIGAGGAAVLVEKGYEKNLILESSFKIDGSFSEDCTVKGGGTKHWPPEPGVEKNLHFTIDDPESFKEKLKDKTLKNFFHVIRDSLEKSGSSTEAIDYLAILHFKRSTHEYILNELGLEAEQTTYLEKFGHIGQNDQIISIEEGLKSGKISDGDTIVLVGAGLGFVWASTVIRWG
jgi:3-oxoacyl-[acyl-carrier-protein] synthase-3